MNEYQTQRLILRPFQADDFEAVHSYASCYENVKYMSWGPNGEEDTRNFLTKAIACARETPLRRLELAAVLKANGRLIGACSLSRCGEDEAVVGWVLHRDYWKRGYGTEMGAFLLRLGFEEWKLRRIVAHCAAENYGSYRVMERNGMRREGCFIQSWRSNRLSGEQYCDKYCYAILSDEWEIRKEMAAYNALPVRFDGFESFSSLSDGEIELVCAAKKPAIPEKKYVPSYEFEMRRDGACVGEIRLRVGYTDSLYYGGQIGYHVSEEFRGRGYAAKACRLLIPVMKAHGMEKVLITNNTSNHPSMRVCEKIGARLMRTARLPEWHDLYKVGWRSVNIYEWGVK